MNQFNQPRLDLTDKANGPKNCDQFELSPDFPLQPLFTDEGIQYYDSRNVTDDEILKQLLRSSFPVRFDWENKWLRGDQYAHMLNNIDAYYAAFGMAKMREKEHPENIYV